MESLYNHHFLMATGTYILSSILQSLPTIVTTSQANTVGTVRAVAGPHYPHCQLSLYQADLLVEVVDEAHLHQHNSSQQDQPQVEERQVGLRSSLTAFLLHCGSCVYLIWWHDQECYHAVGYVRIDCLAPDVLEMFSSLLCAPCISVSSVLEEQLWSTSLHELLFCCALLYLCYGSNCTSYGTSVRHVLLCVCNC